MGYVLDRERLSQADADAAEATGKTIIEAKGTAHKIKFLVDHVTNEPRIIHTIAPSPITIGTRITIKWPPSSERARAYCWIMLRGGSRLSPKITFGSILT